MTSMTNAFDKITAKFKKTLPFRAKKKPKHDEEHSDDDDDDESSPSDPELSPDPLTTEGENASSDESSSSSSEIVEKVYKPDNPFTLAAFGHQASGHSRIFAIDDDKLAKPCNPHESQVYHLLADDDIMSPFVPHFYGVVHLETEEDVEVRYFQKAGEFIVIENLTAGYSKPCVMDLKMGRKGWSEQDHDHLEIQWRKIRAHATTSSDLGFRLGGLKVYRPSLDDYLVRESRYGNRLRQKNLLAVIRSFISDGQRTRVELIPRFIKKLKRLNNALKQNRKFDFRASSVLLVYEGDTTDLNARPRVDVRLIDFDHTEILPDNDDEEDNAGEDEQRGGATIKPVDSWGVRWGVRNIIHNFKKIHFAMQTSYSTSNLSTQAHRRRQKHAPDPVLVSPPDDPVPARTMFGHTGTSPHPFRKYDSVPDLHLVMGGCESSEPPIPQDTGASQEQHMLNASFPPLKSEIQPVITHPTIPEDEDSQ